MRLFTCLLALLLALLLAFSLTAQAEERPVPMAAYLEYARTCADWVWDNYDSLEADWRAAIDPENVFGYRPPPRYLEMAVIYATLFDKEGNGEYASRAKKVLLVYEDYTKDYPEEAKQRRTDYEFGVPALTDFFTVMRYIRAYEILKRHDKMSREEKDKVEAVIAFSMEYLLRTQEWGPMNRTMLRAETLAWAVRTLPDHPHVKKWKTYERALAFDNWGAWEIEDATIYHAVWLYALLGYADARQEMDALFRTPEMYYYAQYFLNLICPDGMIPDFGDANLHSNWSRYMVFFEAAAAVYKDPRMKWAAATLARHFLDMSNPKNIGLAYLLLDASRFGTDEVKPECPTDLSQEVMEDVQGKKIVFRDGWADDSTYLLLNYRDEGDGGLLFRDYLRDTIPVEEEKMTHGHADENSLVMLMSNGSLLLHDGGYRDFMPSGPFGAYRQDYFHNRLCVRQEKIFMGQKQGEYRYSTKDWDAVPPQPVLDFLHNAGSYRTVRTFKVDFLTFPDFDYSRTRLVDDKLGYEWDRVIAWLKEPGLFVVFDIFKGRVEEYFTACNLWHTQKITANGDHWYDTVYEQVGKKTMNSSTRLLIHFPKTHYRFESVEPEKRHYQDEWVICQGGAQRFELGQTMGFVTVLMPHPADTRPGALIDKIRYRDTDPLDRGMCVEVSHAGKTFAVGVKSDQRKDMVRDWRRPKYTWESGRIQYGKLETNSDFFMYRLDGDQLAYTVVNLSKAVFDGQVIFDQLPCFFGLAYDASPDSAGTGKARYWRDEVTVE